MLLPNNKQKTKLFQYANTARFAYNWALAREKENYENGGKFLSDSELRKEFTKLRHTEAYAWLQAVSNNVTKQAVMLIRTFLKDYKPILSLKAEKNPSLNFIRTRRRLSLQRRM